MQIDTNALLQQAREMLDKAYVPYSKFPVGAALLCEDGTVYGGCNIENAAYGPTICAERAAMCRAICDGHQKFVAVAVVAKTGDYCFPCGVCRQTLYEFNPDLTVITGRNDGEFVVMKLHELLPNAFGPVTLHSMCE